ncbi:unnamed protein product, partial [Prunus brigantina]
TESEEASEYICSEDGSSQTEGLVEGLVEARMVVHEGVRSDPPIDSGSDAYGEMQMLEAIADRGLAMPRSSEIGSSNQVSPSGSMSVAVAPASEGVDIRVGIPLPVRNTLTELKLIELQRDYGVPPYVFLRLPTAADVVRYPPEGSVMIFTDMYQHGLRLPLHPWVQMMLAKLGYAPGQYNPNFWLLHHGVYIAWWLVGLGEPTFEQFMYLYSISKQQGTFGWVQANCRKAKERGYFIGHKPSTQKSWRNRWCMASGYWECPPRKIVSRHVPTHFQSIGSVKCGPISKEQEDEVERVRSSLSETERERKNLRPMNDEGRVADVLGKKRALEEAHKSVMGTEPRLPPLDPKAPPKLPFGMDDVYAEGVEKMDFSELRREKKEGYGEMYMHMAKADKEIQKLKRRNEMAKDKIAEAQEAIQEKNTLVLQMAKMKRSRAEEVTTARAEAIESFRGSEELKSYIRNRMVAMQMHWE